MEQVISEVRRAMLALGYQTGTRIKLRQISGDKFQVFRACGFVDDELIGIWDSTKKTFCD